MRTESVTFHSDQFTLSGKFFLPDEQAPDTPAPLVLACSGFTGLAHIHPARFARFLTQRGHRCFGFDYRGFANSQGERGQVLLEEQVRDIRAAVAFAQTDPRVDPDRIILLGWGMAGGLVVDAARQSPGIAALISANGFFNGARVQLRLRGETQFNAFCQRVAEARRDQARSGRWPTADPFDLYPLDLQSRAYVDEVLRKAPQYDAEPYSFALGESLLRFDVESHAPGARLPILIAHGEKNRLHPVEEAETMFERWGGPKDLYWIRDAGHTEFMHDDDRRFQALGEAIDTWLRKRLEEAHVG